MSQQKESVDRIKQAEAVIAEELRKLYKETGLVTTDIAINDLYFRENSGSSPNWVLNSVALSLQVTFP